MCSRQRLKEGTALAFSYEVCKHFSRIFSGIGLPEIYPMACLQLMDCCIYDNDLSMTSKLFAIGAYVVMGFSIVHQHASDIASLSWSLCAWSHILLSLWSAEPEIHAAEKFFTPWILSSNFLHDAYHKSLTEYRALSHRSQECLKLLLFRLPVMKCSDTCLLCFVVELELELRLVAIAIHVYVYKRSASYPWCGTRALA